MFSVVPGATGRDLRLTARVFDTLADASEAGELCCNTLRNTLLTTIKQLAILTAVLRRLDPDRDRNALVASALRWFELDREAVEEAYHDCKTGNP